MSTDHYYQEEHKPNLEKKALADAPPPLRFMDSWVQQKMNKAPGEYRKFIIKAVKRIFVVLALILFGSLIALPFLSPDTRRLNFVTTQLTHTSEAEVGDLNKMIKPHFQGVDKEGQPYNIIAKEANKIDETTVQLKKMTGDITTKEGKWYNISSTFSTINLQEKRMHLTGKVDLYTDAGFEIHTSEAFVNLEEGAAHGEKDVTVQGPMGILKAKGFDVIDNGNSLSFEGPVQLTIHQ